MTSVAFPVKYVGETISEVFDFLSQLAVGEGLTSATVAASVYSGVDASPAAILFGSANISGSKVSQFVTAGTLGVTYLLLCTASTDTGQYLQLAAYLVIAPPPV